MEIFTNGVDILKTIVVGIGAIYVILGLLSYLEGYSSDNGATKSTGAKQFIAGMGIAILGMTLVPMLATLFTI